MALYLPRHVVVRLRAPHTKYCNPYLLSPLRCELEGFNSPRRDMSTSQNSKRSPVGEFIFKLNQDQNNWGKFTRKELAEMATVQCGFFVSEEKIRNALRIQGIKDFSKNGKIDIDSTLKGNVMAKTKKELTTEARLEGQMRSLKDEQRQHGKKLNVVLDDNARLQRELNDALALRSYKPKQTIIKPASNTSKGEATAVALLSDVHCEEVVLPHKVNHLNQYNPDISDKRVARFHQLVHKFIQVDRAESKIDNLLLWWGGDFFTNDMHGAPTALGPAIAVQRAMDQLTSGLRFLLEQDPNLKIHIVGSVGNHSRAQTQKPVNQALEQENSWEWMMYHSLRLLFKDEKRITWTLENSYHSYVNVYGKVIRFNHGHLGWRYNMGLGGVHGPLWKVISQTWDKQVKADLSICGHYHTLTPSSISRPYMVNGSVIGVTPYGMSFGYEPAAQIYFLMHSKYGVINQRALYLDT